MKNLFLFTLFALLGQGVFAQNIKDYKTKNKSNSVDRTLMLDILRAHFYNDYKQEFVFVVKHFKVGGDYAWFMGDAQLKDGKKIELSSEEANDCCHVECLFKKSNGKWYIAEADAFSTDVWWEGIDARNPAAPKGIFK